MKLRFLTMRISRRRRGVSPVIAEVCLIAVLLVSAIMLVSLTFGVFSFYISPAEVEAESALCSAAGNTTMCLLTLTNTGAQDTFTTGSCTLDAGAVLSGNVVNGGTVPAGGSLTNVQCVTHGVDPSPGSQVSGVLSLTNGGTAFFVGTVQ